VRFIVRIVIGSIAATCTARWRSFCSGGCKTNRPERNEGPGALRCSEAKPRKAGIVKCLTTSPTLPTLRSRKVSG
jgi:hypothetical protein